MQPRDVGVGNKDFEDDFFVGVVGEGSGSLGSLVDLECLEVNFAVGDGEVGLYDLATVMDVNFSSGDLASDDPAANVVFFAVGLVVFQFLGTVYDVCFDCFQRHQPEEGLIVLNGYVLL